MKIACLMWYNSGIKEYADINYKINKIYCDNHGIDLIVSSEEKYTDGRTKHWEKLPMVLQELERGTYDYVIWIDSDAYFYVDSPDILDLILDYSDKCFIFSDDINKKDIWKINSGFFIVKNCPESLEILREWAWNSEYKRLSKKIFPGEQTTLWYMYEENILNVREKSVSLEYGFLQHFNSCYDTKSCLKNPYHKYGYPFVNHFPGKKKEYRIEVSRKYYEALTCL